MSWVLISALSESVPNRGNTNEYLRCFKRVSTNIYLDAVIALDRLCFFQSKSINIFLISPQKHMLWVLIRSALPRHF